MNAIDLPEGLRGLLQVCMTNGNCGPPTAHASGDATNGRVARELPVASALLIRRDLAQVQSVRDGAALRQVIAQNQPAPTTG